LTPGPAIGHFERVFKPLNARSRADLQRSAILAGAVGAFRRHGTRGAGMREIAREVGLSPGNLYYYFRNKEELVWFCQDRTLDALLAVVREARAEAGAAAQLAHLVLGHLRVLLGEQSAGPLHLELDGLPPRLLRRVVEKRDRYERAVRAIVVAGQRRGEVREGDPKLCAFALLGALNWTARWFHAGGGFTPEEVAEHFEGQLLSGLLSPKNGKTEKRKSR
jgi:AcrR family transcriptional regulator